MKWTDARFRLGIVLWGLVMVLVLLSLSRRAWDESLMIFVSASVLLLDPWRMQRSQHDLRDLLRQAYARGRFDERRALHRSQRTPRGAP